LLLCSILGLAALVVGITGFWRPIQYHDPPQAIDLKPVIVPFWFVPAALLVWPLTTLTLILLRQRRSRGKAAAGLVRTQIPNEAWGDNPPRPASILCPARVTPCNRVGFAV
jgi:hypothetical protein